MLSLVLFGSTAVGMTAGVSSATIANIAQQPVQALVVHVDGHGDGDGGHHH